MVRIARRSRRAPQSSLGVTISRLILEKLAELGEAAVSSFFPANYPEARLWRRILGWGDDYRFKRETFSALLSRLRAQGLVTRSGSRQNSFWRLTTRGRTYVAASQRPEPRRSDGIRRLVIFDVPERERVKRNAIRSELTVAGFVQLQKSVWQGTRPLPQDFLRLVDALGLRSCLHIFSVRDEGTLRQ